MIPLFLPPGVPLAVKNGLFDFQQGKGSFLAPASALFFETVGNVQFDIGFNGSCFCDILIL